MNPYPDPERSYQEAVIETLNTAMTGLFYYYNYFKENYIEPTIERLGAIHISTLPLWQWQRQIPTITYHPQNPEVLNDDQDYINWAALLDEGDEKETPKKS